MIEQYGLISAVLGGFAFTFVGAILAMNDKRKIIDLAFLLGVISASIFFICALGWTLIAPGYAEQLDNLSPILSAKHRFLSLLFLTGILTLSSCLGASGWIRSRRVGILTTIINLIGIIMVVYLIKDYIN